MRQAELWCGRGGYDAADQVKGFQDADALVVERAQRRVAAGVELRLPPHVARSRARQPGRSRTSTSSNPAALSPAWRSTRRSRSGTTAPGAPLDGSVITGYPATVTAQRVRVRSR